MLNVDTFTYEVNIVLFCSINMTDNEETSESAKKSEDLNEQSALPEMKKCIIQLEKIDFKGFLNTESDLSDDDLPALPYLVPKSKKIKKSNKELLEEYENLARNIQVGNSSDYNVEEKLKMISIVDTDEVEDASLSPPTIVNEEKDIKVFFANDTLQFFNICDVTFEQCGYDSMSADLTEFEKIFLSFKRIELDHVLSTFLISCDIHFISDLKSFILFLLRNLSVRTDLASVKACYDALTFILIKHPDAKMLNFSSAEIFMLLFNYGADISSFKILEKRMDIQSIWNNLEEPKDKCRNKIPDNWVYNLKTTLNAVAVLITNCEFKLKHLCDIIIYLLFMTLDDSVLNEDLYLTIRECINVGLDHISKDKWPKVLREIACAFITDDFVNSQDQWRYLFRVVESVPVTSKRGTELRKYISYLALTLFGEIQLYIESPEQRVEVNKALNGFSLYELQSLLKRIIQNGSDAVITFASKFLNICISYLDATDEELLKELCVMLKDSECVLNERSHEAKACFLKIHARLMIRFGGNSGFKVLTEKDEGLRKKIKKEVDINKDSYSSYPLVKVKKEPGIENMPFVMGHSSDKIISFSAFDCENNDEEMDFNDVYGSDTQNSNSLLKNKIIKVDPVILNEQSSELPISSPLPSHSSSSDEQSNSTKNVYAVETEEMVSSEECSFHHVSKSGSFSPNHDVSDEICSESSNNYCKSPMSELSVENNNINQNSSNSGKEGNDCCVSTLPPGISVTCITNVNQVDLSSATYNIESTSNNFTENNMTPNSSFSKKEVNDCYVPTLPPGISVTPITNVNQIELSSTTYNVESTSNNFAENNNMTPNSSFSKREVNDCYVPTFPPDISVTPITIVNHSDLSPSCNLKDTSNSFPDKLNILLPERSLDNSAAVNSFNKTTFNDLEQNDTQFSPEAENYPTNRTNLLEQPPGDGILPMVKKIDSPLPGPSKQNVDVCFEQCKASNDKDKVIISENTLQEKGMKKSNEIVETIESDGSDKELQILFIAKRKTPLILKKVSKDTKSFKEKSKYLNKKADYDTDDEVMIITENLSSSQICSTSFQSPSTSLTDSSYNAVNNRNIAVVREDAVVPQNFTSENFKLHKTIRTPVKISSDGGSIEQSNLPSEKMCTSQDSRTPMNNNDLLGNEYVTTTADGTVLSGEKSISVKDNTIFEEVNVNIEALTTQAILDIQSVAAEGQESGMNTSSAKMEELVIDESDLTNNNIQENGAIISSTIIKSASSLDDGKLSTNEYIQSMKFQSRMNSSRKINSKRKSISNDGNHPLHTHSIEHDDNKEIVLILNDMLESFQKKDDVCEASQCTPTSNSITQFNSSSNLSPFSVSSPSSPHLTMEPELSSPNSIHQNIQNQAEAAEISPVCSHSNLVEGNNNENNISRPETSKRPVFESIDKNPRESSPRISESQSPKKRKNSVCSVHSVRDECILSSNKKLKSSDDQQSRVNSDRTVTSSSPDHLTLETDLTSHNSVQQSIENQEETEEINTKCSQSLKSKLVEGLKKLNKEDILTPSGLELTTVLRQNLASNSSNQVPSSIIVEADSSSGSDSDIFELYTDPKNYADEECLLIYDSHNIIVLDDSD